MAATLGCAAVVTARAESKVWSGGAADGLWSSAANWTPPGQPGLQDGVTFNNEGATDVSMILGGTASSTVDQAASGTIKTLRYSNITGYHNTMILKPLVVQGSSAADAAFVSDDGHPAIFFVGSGQADAAADAVYASMGGGALAVTNANAVISVMQASITSGAHRATLDMSPLNSFACAVSNVLVGHDFGDPITRPTGTLILANTNEITAKMISLGEAYQNAGQISYIYLGQKNTLYVDRLRIALHKCLGTIQMRDGLSDASVTFRGFSGSGRQTSWEIGDEYEPNTTIGYFTSSQSIGILNMTGAVVDALVDTIVLGRGQTNAPTRTGDGNGTLTFGGGTVNANRVEMGMQLTGGASVGHGTLNLNNDLGTPAKLTVNGDLVMAVQLAGNTDANGSTADLNINGGILEVAGNAVDGGGNVTMTISNGGIVDMMPAGDTTPGDLSVDTLNITGGEIWDYGTLSVSTLALTDTVDEFTVLAGHTLSPAGTAAGVLAVTSGTLKLQGNLLLDVQKSGTTLKADSITGTVVYGGTLEVRRSGDALAVGDKFTLFGNAVAADLFANVILPAAGAGLAFKNNLATDGTIEVIASGEPAERPQISIASSANAITISWPAAYTSYVLQGQTNSTSVGISSNWGPVSGAAGNQVTIPINPANGVAFFQLIQQ
ncbi:MAG TPA: hypothetical protein VM680_15300 [Verrucomicrobiae bacterium]|nr:hypothetical protein [Verrucomicrobiae bacterium]